MANPIYSWGVVRKVTFPGVNMDIGHVRNITWAKDNDDKKWVAYNRLRGQYMSALEHAVPERFFNDPQKCNLQGTTTPTAGLPDCPQGISAVKALGIAAQQGQRIYTITQKVYNDNPGIVSNALSAHSWDTQNRVQQSLDAGYEVTIHERPITESGWTGAGYTAIDSNTGAGAYTIEGGSNGGVFFGILYAIGASLLFALIGGYQLALLFTILSVLITPLGAAIVLLAVSAALLFYSAEMSLQNSPCAKAFFQGVSGLMLSLLPFGAVARTAAIVEAITISSLNNVTVGGGFAAALGIGACLL